MQLVSTVTEAIVRLGTAAVRNVVVTVCFTSRMHDAGVYGAAGPRLVDHALGTAYLARLVAERARVNTDEAFLCGLLHDFGKLVILKQAYDYRQRTGRSVPEAELKCVIAERHAVFGAMALRRWKLPESLDEPVMFHHDPSAAPSRPRESAVIYLANRLSYRYGFGCDLEEWTILEDPISAELGIDAVWLADVDARAPGLVKVARETLS
jgi:putative nucleotidyltransferase with HDIG domain